MFPVRNLLSKNNVCFPSMHSLSISLFKMTNILVQVCSIRVFQLSSVSNVWASVIQTIHLSEQLSLFEITGVGQTLLKFTIKIIKLTIKIFRSFIQLCPQICIPNYCSYCKPYCDIEVPELDYSTGHFRALLSHLVT